MADQVPLILKRPIWYGREGKSPKLPDGFYGIEFEQASAEGPFGDTVALFATVRLGPRHAEMYGARAGAATEIVAIDSETGLVYHGRGTRIDSAPFEPVILADREFEEMDAMVETVESNFNVDLCAQLGLPPGPALYHVFCWLDDVRSPLSDVDMPASDGRPKGAPEANVNVPGLVAMSAAEGDLPQGAGRIFMRYTIDQAAQAEHATQDTIRAGVSVFGQVDPEVLPTEPPLPGEAPLWLTVFVRSHLDRDFAQYTVPVPGECIEGRSLAFQLHPFRILDLSERPQRYFVLVAVGNVISEVLTIEPLGQQPG